MPETPFFSCEKLSLDLGGREVLSNIGLELHPGEVLGIIGPNGAGKTSLLEILSGRYTPKSGKVLLEGRNINNLSLFQRARLGIGRTYQTPIVPEELTVGETMKAARQAFRILRQSRALPGPLRPPDGRPENLRTAQALDGMSTDAPTQNPADGRARSRAHQC
jgi:ABC-type branched-subunit amino acid transport system ATPase component